MEKLKIKTLPKRAFEIGSSAVKFCLHQMGGSGWSELGDKYGEAVGGYKRHPASITVISTPPEKPDPEPPTIPPPPVGSNSWVRPKDPTEMEKGWESYNISEEAA